MCRIGPEFLDRVLIDPVEWRNEANVSGYFSMGYEPAAERIFLIEF